MRSLPWSLLDRLLTGPADPQRTGWLRRWTYAHRGLHRAGSPENSLAAFAGALEAGLGIECDIQRSRDGEAMLLHDWELERLTGISGPLAGHDAADLAQIAFTDSEHYIARLADLLELVDGRVPILIEIKSRARYDVKRSCAAVARSLAGYRGDIAVMSFDPRVPKWFRKHYPAPVRGLVMREDSHGATQKGWQRHLALWIARPEFLAYHVDALPSPMVAGLKARGFPILSWTVDTPEKRAIAAAHADAPIAEAEGLV